MPKIRTKRRLELALCLLALPLLAVLLGAPLTASDEQAGAAIVPNYDDEGRLRLPEEIERWVLAGTSLGLSYTEGEATGEELFHHTLIEPTAYEHFRSTGTFRNGTMLALLLHPQGHNELPSRAGQFADDLAFLEMAVKDEGQTGGWAYYNFGRPGSRAVASALPERSCKSCHDQHAAYDNVFVQFYPLLRSAAPEASPAHAAWAERSAADPAQSARGPAEEPVAAPAVLALGGNDPVLLVEGRREEGKAEIEVEHNGYLYRFLSAPSRKRFADDPERYSIQNETCPVVAGAPVDPSLVSVHRGKIYAFATPGCVTTFEADPESFVSDPASDAESGGEEPG